MTSAGGPSRSSDSLAGEIALVTGAAQGLGAAIARRLADAGAIVAATDLDGPGAVALAQDLGGQALGIELDVAEAGSVTSAVEQITSRVGAPTVLVNNAGIARVGPSEELSWEDWAAVVEVNLNGVFRVTQALAPAMLDAGRGAIVNVASANAAMGSPGRAAYCSTKTGVLGLTRALAVEWAGRGVRVNAVLPGYIDTRLLQSCFHTGLIPRDFLLDRIPAGTLGQPGQIAETVCFLASPAAEYVTGQEIAVDGGFLVNGSPAPVSAGPARPLAL